MKSRSIAFVLSGVLLWSAGHASLEFKRIVFPPQRPGDSETRSDINHVLGAEQYKVLQELLQALKDSPVIGVKVIGFADRNECSGTECDALSLRRAQIVFEWLLTNGIPAERLRGPVGESTQYPLSDGETKEERAENARVQLEPFPLSEERSS